MSTHYLACDLGAESGRLIAGSLDGEKLSLAELHRFPNTPVRENGSLHWNIGELFSEVKAGLRKAGKRLETFSSISTDSWGVDYLLFDKQGNVMPPSFHYRDHRTQQGMQQVLPAVPWEILFAETGIQLIPINTLFQVVTEPPERLKRAEYLLGVADGFNYLLSGVNWAEESMASTTQLYNPKTKTWSNRLISVLGLPREIFPPIVPSGTRLGPLRPELAEETGLRSVDVIASCSHDTGAAVAAVPAEANHWAYISSGTWSLMGIELALPILTETCRDLNFTNEVGFGGSIRLLKNIVGLWVVQECRRHWAAQGQSYDYEVLTRLAEDEPPFTAVLDLSDPRFLAPDQMPQRIAEFCKETGQSVPSSPGAIVRCALESLALLYRRTMSEIEQITGNRLQALHIVGGGSKNSLLNQFTANAVGIPVIAGPAEATSAGNILVQALALGHVRSLQEARRIVRGSFELVRFDPQERNLWEEAYGRFSTLLNRPRQTG